MDKNLNIQLILKPGCKLIAVDNSDFDSIGIDLLNHASLEFLSFKESEFPKDGSVLLKPHINLNQCPSSEFILNEDGTYSYYKLIIPYLDHFKNMEDKYCNLYNELYYYEGNIYKSNTPMEEAGGGYDKGYVLSNSEKIINYIEAYKLVQMNHASQTFYCLKEKIFSVCKLQACLAALQKQALYSGSCECSFSKCNLDENLRNRRDFLLSALYVFDYLTDSKNYEEAQRILDNLSTCESLCGEELINLNDCGCGNSI